MIDDVENPTSLSFKKKIRKLAQLAVKIIEIEKAIVYMHVSLLKFIIKKVKKNKLMNYAENPNLTSVYKTCVLIKHNQNFRLVAW